MNNISTQHSESLSLNCTSKSTIQTSFMVQLFWGILLVFFASQAFATSPPPELTIANHSPISIQVIDERGHVFRSYHANSHHNQHQRHYLEAKKGKRYQLRVRNHSGRRVGVVIAVDGRNIISGKKSWLRHNERMYILGPYESATYSGWRTGKDHVNRFYFTSAGNSYANAWGDRSAMGVIAVAVFNEKIPVYRHKKYNQLDSQKTPQASARRHGFSADESTGTGFGKETWSPTRQVKFTAKHRPVAKHFYKYEWRRTLCKRGIIHCGHDVRPPNRFWPNEVNNGYAPYPPNHWHQQQKPHRKERWSDQFTRHWKEDYNRGW